MSDVEILRQHLVSLLNEGNAHATFDQAIENLPAELRGRVPEGAPHSPWQLLEHLRLAQEDILDFSRNPEYQERKWPEDYWPKSPAPPSTAAWDESLKQIRADREAFEAILTEADTDGLIAPFPWGDSQTLLREELLVADHVAYHVGELIVIRRLLGCWK